MSVAAAVALVVLTAFSSSASSRAAEPEAYGWWHKAQQIPNNATNLPPPPGVPADGMFVANEPSGPFAISAVRYAAESDATLTLPVAGTGQSGTPAVMACPSTATWDSAVAGRWDNRPAYDCKTNAEGKLTPDGKGMAFALKPDLQRNPGTYDLVIVPTASPVPFTIAFERPTEASFAAAPASTSSDAPPFDSGSAPADQPSYDEPSRDFAFSGDPGFTAAPETPASGPPSASPILPVPTGPAAAPALPIPDTRGERIAAVVVLLAMVLGLWWFGGHPARAPRMLGSMGSRQVVVTPERRGLARLGGVGRFARPRDDAPQRL